MGAVQALVTGATGCVGHALSRRLLEIGWPTRVLVRSQRQDGARERRLTELRDAGASVCDGDLADPNSIAAAAEACEVLFHCAGEGSHRASPKVLSWLNVAGTENVIQAARHAEVARVVMLSCADVTLNGRDRINWKEEVALGRAPLGELARAKQLAEELALQANSASMTVAALRPALLGGPGEQRLLPQLCAEARTGRVQLFGSGDNLLATTHVENAVDALVAAAQAEDVGGKAIHVADAEHHTASEFIERLCGALGLPPPKRGLYALAYASAWLRQRRGADGPWPTDVVRRARGTLLDCLLAHSILDLSPSTTVEEGMQELARWAREVGGPAAIEKLARQPSTEADVAHHEAVAASLNSEA